MNDIQNRDKSADKDLNIFCEYELLYVSNRIESNRTAEKFFLTSFIDIHLIRWSQFNKIKLIMICTVLHPTTNARSRTLAHTHLV